jgi:hypothetical protein
MAPFGCHKIGPSGQKIKIPTDLERGQNIKTSKILFLE